MASITIRDVPDDVRDELAARARLSGRSLQEYLKMHLVGLTSRPDPQVLIEQVRARTKRTGSRLSAERILAHRDHDRCFSWSLMCRCWWRHSSTVVRTADGSPAVLGEQERAAPHLMPIETAGILRVLE